MSNRMDAIADLARRRGFFFSSSEIYGGMDSTWDYGPLGVALKRNVQRSWWRSTVQLRGDVVGQDSATIMAPAVWVTSGKVESLSEPVVECTNCHQRQRLDQTEQALDRRRRAGDRPVEGACPNCGKGPFADPRNFNLMFRTFMGPAEDAGAAVWLRPDVFQGLLVNFPIVQAASRKKLPFGIAQAGKCFRNEITPGNLTFRAREFDQMAMAFFVQPGDDEEWHARWVEARRRWYLDHGVQEGCLRLREQSPEEFVDQAKAAVNLEYRFPFGWSEVEVVANRADFDLARHQKASGEDLSYHDPDAEERYIPYVIEQTAGVDRSALAFLVDAYREEEAPTASGGTETRVVLRLDKRLAPMKAAVLPLSRNERLLPLAREVTGELRERWMIDYDDARSIGRRYRRQDEIGTPYCVTVDFDSLGDRAVTVRDRDTMRQDRVGLDRLVAYLDERLPRV